MIFYVAVALIAAIVTFVLAIVIYRLSLKHRLYPKVRERDVHTRPTPRLGGIAMFAGVGIAFGMGRCCRRSRSSTTSRARSSR